MKKTNRASAFTVVELLLAASLTVIIVVLLGTMFGKLANTATRSNQRVDAFRDARAAMQRIQSDFSALVAAKATAYFVINNDASNSSGSTVRHLYGLVALKNRPAAAAGIPSDVCSVGYYCSWDNTTSSYRLLRYFKDSAVTFNTIQTAMAGGYAKYTDLYKLTASDEVLAAYCWNLQVTPYDNVGNAMTVTYPYVCDTSATATGVLPAAIEISFKAISPAAARTATKAGVGANVWMAYDQTATSQADKTTYDRMIGPYTYQFRTRINLQ